MEAAYECFYGDCLGGGMQEAEGDAGGGAHFPKVVAEKLNKFEF